MLPPQYFYWFRIDNKHMTEPWLDQALMDSAYRSDIFPGHKLIPTPPPFQLYAHTHYQILKWTVVLWKVVELFKAYDKNSRPIPNGVSWGPQKIVPDWFRRFDFFSQTNPQANKHPSECRVPNWNIFQISCYLLNGFRVPNCLSPCCDLTDVLLRRDNIIQLTLSPFYAGLHSLFTGGLKRVRLFLRKF